MQLWEDEIEIKEGMTFEDTLGPELGAPILSRNIQEMWEKLTEES